MLNLQPATVPAYLKCGFFGSTGTGKTWTAAKVLAQFIAEYEPKRRLVMFDTEPGAGYIAPMVKKITGQDLLVIVSRSFTDLIEFTALCEKDGHVGLIDSITHPWRQLCQDYLDAKRSRVQGAGGRKETTKLSLKDWGPIKEMWARFSEPFAMNAAHLCICGREGDTWETVTDDEGKEEMQKTGVKMKTEVETGHEPSLLVQMRLEGENPVKHTAFVVKDRFDYITGKTSPDKPDIEFFRPHIEALDLKGKAPQQSIGSPAFEPGSGPNWETIKAQREAILEEIKNDITLLMPGQTAAEKSAKILALRESFGTSAWAELENDDRKWSVDNLKNGREKLSTYLKGLKNEVN